MLRFRDFVPKQVKKPGFLQVMGQHESFESAVQAAGEWLRAESIRPLQLETVVLPNMWDEEGSTDVALFGKAAGVWYQFLRVWYDDERDVEKHPFR